MNLKKHVLGILLAIAVPVCAYAQNVTVKGLVKDDAGEPLALVSIAEQGTSNGTVTDLDGNYSISVPSNATLQFSFMGYTTVTEQVNGRTTINVTLSEDAELLEEVVVIGYGVQKKSDLTGAVASVRAADLKNRPMADAAAALQGKVSGVQVLTTSGAPGSGSEIRVRGYSSNSDKIGPLLIVDGLQVDNIQYLDPEMIANVEVLKDAASAAIYGAQAGNGVVLITTKSGSANKGSGRIFYNSQFQLSQLSRKLDIMNAQNYIDYGMAQGFLSQSMLDDYYDGTTDVDWGKEVFVPTWSQRHTFGFQGGDENGSVFMSINTVHNNGIFKGDKDVYDRLTMQLNADYKIKKWLTLGTNNSIEKWNTKSVSQQNDNGSAMLATITSSPLFPVRGDENHLSAAQKLQQSLGVKILKDSDTGLYWTLPLIGETQSGSPFTQRDATDSYSGGFNVRGVSYVNFMPLKSLTFTSRLGYRLSYNTSHSYTEPYYANAFVKADNYTISANAYTSWYYQWENFANFNKDFGKSNVNVMAGMSYIENNWDNVETSATGKNILMGYADNFLYMDYLLNDGVTKTIRNAPGRSANLSYFGRIGYSYDDRYSIQANFRADAFDSSKLPKESRWGYFPSVSAGWAISNESFIKDNIDPSVLSFLKLRASWGQNGNVNVLRDYPYSTSVRSNVLWYQYHVDDPTLTTGSVTTGAANPSLKWETAEQLDLGIDARFFDNRLTVGLDYFDKTTKDLLVGAPVACEVGLPAFGDKGFSTTPTINAGEVSNKGIEFELGWKDKIGDLSYAINGNVAHLSNMVTYIVPTVDRIAGRTPQGTHLQTTFEQGHPIWYMLGYQFTHIDEEGNAHYVDQNGDNKIDENDRVDIGCGIPDWTFGITVNLEWKNFDFTVFGTGVAGNEIYPTSFRVDRPSCNTYSYYWDHSWKKAGDEATAKFPAANHWTTEAFSSTLNVFDGSYFKIKTIELGYTLPRELTRKAYISNCRVFASLDNFFTFSKYIGLDPETATTGGNAAGIDMGTYPTSKSLIFGVNIDF